MDLTSTKKKRENQITTKKKKYHCEGKEPPNNHLIGGHFASSPNTWLLITIITIGKTLLSMLHDPSKQSP